MNHLFSLPILASILILGVFAVGLSFDDAEAKKSEGPIFKVGGENIIKINKGTATCTNQEEPCEVKTLKTKFRLLTTEANDDTATGVARGEIRIVAVDVNPMGKILRNQGPLSYTYDNNNRILIMSGTFIDQNNITYEYDAVGNIAEPKNSKAKIDLSIQLVGDNGIIIDATGAGFIEREGGDDLF